MFLGVPGQSNADSMREFVDTHGAGAFQHVDDTATTLWSRFGVTNQSTYVYINDDGTWERTGYGSLISDVEELLSQ